MSMCTDTCCRALANVGRLSLYIRITGARCLILLIFLFLCAFSTYGRLSQLSSTHWSRRSAWHFASSFASIRLAHKHAISPLVWKRSVGMVATGCRSLCALENRVLKCIISVRAIGTFQRFDGSTLSCPRYNIAFGRMP